jgi:hypothetical protein
MTKQLIKNPASAARLTVRKSFINLSLLLPDQFSMPDHGFPGWLEY